MNYHAIVDRIDRLRAHIRRSGKRGDQQALTRLVQLRQELERHRVSSLTTNAFDLMMQELYPDDAVMQNAFAANPFFAMLKKSDENVPPDRAYLVPISFLPEPRHVGVLPLLRDAEGDHAERGGSEEDEQTTAPLCSQGPSEARALPRVRQGRMSHIVDDEPPIKTHPANKAYRDNWDRIFGATPEDTTPTPPVDEPEYKCPDCGTCVEDLHGSGCSRSVDE